MNTTNDKSTDLYEDNGGGLHLVHSDKVYHLPSICGAPSAPNGTYATHVADLSWLADFEAENPDDVESAESWLDKSLYDDRGCLRNDGGMERIASTDHTGAVSILTGPFGRPCCGVAGSNFLGIAEEK